MYVMGGKTPHITASVLRYDSMQNTWREVAPMPTARFGFAACVVGRYIYVSGDWSTGNPVPVYKFDTEVEEWSILPLMPVACNYPYASVLDGLVYITGSGITGRKVLSFDPASGMWVNLASTLSNRKCGAAFVLSGLLYSAGGYYIENGFTISTSSVERYDVASNTWVVMPRVLEGRRHFGAVTIGSAGPAEEQDLFD
jgi:N-acetylneuraminic acid mutarotase